MRNGPHTPLTVPSTSDVACIATPFIKHVALALAQGEAVFICGSKQIMSKVGTVELLYSPSYLSCRLSLHVLCDWLKSF